MLRSGEGTFPPGSRWRGINGSVRPEDLPPGFVATATNLTLDGEDLLSRPGADGQLTSPLANAIRAFTPFASGALFVSGGTSTGKLYYWVSGATSATEILKGVSSLAFTTAGVQVAQAVGVGFLVDGVGTLVRTTSSAASDVTELDKPTAAPVATLTYQSLQNLGSSALTWTQNYITGTTAAPATSGLGATISPRSSITGVDGNFWDSGHTTGTAFWVKDADATCSPNILTANGDNCIELDSNNWATSGVHEYVESTAILLNPNAQANGYARVFVVEYEAAGEDTTQTSEVVDLIVNGYSNAGATTVVSSAERRRRSPFLPNDKATRIRELIDWRGVTVASSGDLLSMTLKWEQPFVRGSNKGTDVNRAALYFPRMELDLKAGADSRLTVRQGTVQVWAGLGSSFTQSGSVSGGADPQSSAQSGRLLCSGLKLTTSLASNQNWSGVRTVGLEVIPAAGVSGLAMRIGFKVSSTWYYTESLSIPDGGGWAIADLKDTAASLTAVSNVLVEFLSDVSVEGIQEGGDSPICRLGELRSVGNLPEGMPVWYRLVEMDEASDSTNLLDVIYSDGSPATGLLEATRSERQARLKFVARKNNTNVAEWFALYRFGGSFVGSGQAVTGRLVCMLRWDTADFAFGGDTEKGVAPRIVALGNPYVSWDKVDTGAVVGVDSILIDNTPDSWLMGADTYVSGREKAPSAPAAVASFANRLWLAQGADLYGSWLLNAAASAGIYWSRLQIPEESDPDAARKGHWERLSLPSGDSIQRMIALPDALIVLTKELVFRVERTGQAVPAFAVNRLWDKDAQGVVSHHAACELDGTAWWVTPGGLRVSDGQSVRRAGDELHDVLASASSGDLAAARLTACPVSRKLFLSLGSTLYVYHAGRGIEGGDLELGWTTWTGLSSLLAADVAGVLHLAGESGQIWKMTQAQDDAGAVAIVLETRRDGGSGYEVLYPTRLWAHIIATASESLVFTITGDSSALSAEITQALTTGEWDWYIDPGHTAEGKRLQIKLTASCAGRLRIKGLGLESLQKRRA